MMKRLTRFSSLVWIFCAATIQTSRADLFDYLKKPEPTFRWKFEEKVEDPFGLAVTYRLKLDSQVWQEIPWTHELLELISKPSAG